MELYSQYCPICKQLGTIRQIYSNIWQNDECKHVFTKDL